MAQQAKMLLGIAVLREDVGLSSVSPSHPAHACTLVAAIMHKYLDASHLSGMSGWSASLLALASLSQTCHYYCGHLERRPAGDKLALCLALSASQINLK